MASQAHRSASPHAATTPSSSTGTLPSSGAARPLADNRISAGGSRNSQVALPLFPPPLRVDSPRGRRRSSRQGPRRYGQYQRRRTGPCTISYRLVAARAGTRVLRAPAWLRTVRSSPAVAALRADAARTVLDVAAALALTARADSTAAPTWPALMEASERSRATVARVLAWLRTHQLLVTLENGSTEQFRPTPRARRDRPAPVPVQGNRAAVYLLTEALPEEAPDELLEGLPEESRGELPQSPFIGQPNSALSSADHHPRVELVSRFLRDETPPHHPSGAVGDQPRAGARAKLATSLATALPPRGAAGRTAQRAGGRLAAVSARSHVDDADRIDRVDRVDRVDEIDHVPALGQRVGYRRGGLDGTRGSRGQQRAGDLAAAEQLRTRALDLRPLSPAAIRAVVRPFLAAGWGVEDLVWAIDHAPDGTRRTYAAGSPTTTRAVAGADLPADVATDRRRRGVRVDDGAPAARPVAFPAAWLRWRLAPWAGLAGPVAASRAAAAERSVAARAAAQARRVEQAAAVAAAVPPPVVLAEARAALRARRTW